MPRSQGTSRKGKPKKNERAAGMGRALERSQQKRYKPKTNGSTRGAGGMISSGAQSIGLTTDEDGHPKNRSVLELDDLSDFLGQAEMAGREFASERERFVVLDSGGVEYRPELEREPAVTFADEQEARDAERRRNDTFRFKELSVPRRPEWDAGTTPEQLEVMERQSFLEWRRGIARREEDVHALGGGRTETSVTPFEKNLDVWRQLWRVLERSDCVVQIVDGRNPLFYLSSDLRTYATDELGRPMLVLINKSDYLTARQRRTWHDYLRGRDIEHVFFSAFEEQKKLDDKAREGRGKGSGERDARLDGYNDGEDDVSSASAEKESDHDCQERPIPHGPSSSKAWTDDFGVDTPLTRDQLLSALPDFARTKNITPSPHNDGKVQFGMVGFPNVGKSSVINVLVGSSKHSHGVVRVGVASQPGKTKHFQTLHLPDRTDVMLCDCPGLVFPSFVSSTADLIAAGVYPIAQMRDHWPVVELVCRRIPREVLNAHYGITLPRPSLQDLRERGLAPPHEPDPGHGEGSTATTVGGGGARLPPPTAEELLGTYCVARSLLAPASGVPDYQRASRVVIKDYVEGTLLYCHCPPNLSEGKRGYDSGGDVIEDDAEFQRETLLTAFRNTRKLKDKLDKLGVELDQADNAAAPVGGSIGAISEQSGQDDADAAEDDLELGEFDGLGVEDDLDILDVVGGFAAEDDEGSKPNGGKRGKAHKKIQKWGKKGRKKANKDPYGCHSEPDVALLSSGTTGGVYVNAGKYGASGYTRPDYSGARGAVKFEGKKSRKKHPI